MNFALFAKTAVKVVIESENLVANEINVAKKNTCHRCKVKMLLKHDVYLKLVITLHLKL